ncbi:MAG: TonB-dependent receptor domain-containing protein, partial [Nevskiales bacterium]
AYAQDSDGGKSTTLQGVQVTGTRIKSANLTSSSSLIVIDDKELKLEGTTNVESLLNSMPQTFAGFSTNDSNGATGTATVDLRGLGPQETLVLIDGKRLMPGDPLQTPPSADLNFIPAALVDRIDIVSGGASAIYGSDAVAGVVNFIMKKDFQGFRVDAQASRTDHSDGSSYDTTLIWGNNFAGGKGNVTLYAGYTKMEAVNEGQRGYSSCALGTGYSTTPGVYDYHYCGGSGTIVDSKFASAGRTAYNAALPKGSTQKLNTTYYVNPNGSAGLIPYAGNEHFNFAPYNYLQRPDKRWSLGGFAHDQINSHLDVYGSAMFMDNHTVAAVAPTGLFGTTAGIPCNSSLLTASDAANLCGGAFDLPGTTLPNGAPLPDLTGGTGVATVTISKRLTEIGPRISDLRHDQFRIQTGARGDIIDGVSYDVSYQYGTVVYSSGTLNYLNTANAAKALTVIVGPALLPDGKTANPQAGKTECQSVYNGTDPACVPLNLFQANKIDAAQLAYIRANGFAQASQVEQVLTSSVSADLGRYGVTSPLAKNGLGLSGGYEYRTESLDYEPDSLVAAGTLGGVGGPSPAVSGAFQVPELFTEMQLPIIENLPGAKLLKFDAAYQWANYSTANDAHTWKTGLEFAPTNDVLFRAGFARATRAPSVAELFSPAAFGLIGGSDPCSGTSPTASLANCQKTGVTAAQYTNIPVCNAGQCNDNSGGSTALRPELSITRSIGVVLTPTMVKNLSISIDYHDIYIDGAIGINSVTSAFNQCFTAGIGCSGFHRGAIDGGLSGDTTTGAGYFDDFLQNTGSLRTKGIDVEADYRIRLRDIMLGNNGQFTVNYVATWTESFQQEAAPGAGLYNCAGMYGPTCGVPDPRYRHKMRFTWISPFGLTLSANWRYFGGVKLDSNSADPNLNNGVVDIPDNKLGAKQYLDLSGTYTLPIQKENITLRAGISNIGGQTPPLVDTNTLGISSPPFGNANTYPNVYDALGRVLFVGVTADF